MAHAQERAEQRYYITDFNSRAVLKDIWNDKCVLMKSDVEKYSNTFMVRYINKFVKVVTDLDVNFVKTVMPLKNDDFNVINELLPKLV